MGQSRGEDHLMPSETAGFPRAELGIGSGGGDDFKHYHRFDGADCALGDGFISLDRVAGGPERH